MRFLTFMAWNAGHGEPFTNFVGIKSPNPFWLASAPPTDKEYNVVRAFKAGWGGVVWKTLGIDPPIVNVNGPRYGVVWGADRRLLGLNNIELITDRPLDVNLQEIKQVKRDWPDRAMVVSLMVPCDEESWKYILAAWRRRRPTGRAELRLPARDERARHGLGRGAGARIHRDGRALVQAAHPDAGDREADAEHHRHPLSGARGAARAARMR
jgi:dihydropyrimidine dehydrogenase (NAD+) subunit PreA